MSTGALVFMLVVWATIFVTGGIALRCVMKGNDK